MTGNILIRPSVQKRFDSFMEHGRVLFFSAPCGFGKTSLADALLPLMDTNLTGNDLMDILFALSEADMPQAFHTASLSLLPGEEYALNPADVQAYREALYGKEEKQ